jgi:hypothetical protein
MPNTPQFSCNECGKDSGSSLVCRDCIPLLSAYQRGKYMKAWHRIVIEAAGNACVDCGRSATVESGELCGDHIQTKGSRPDLVFDVTNGRCVCLDCHNQRHSQGLPKPKGGKETKPVKFKKPPVCEVKGCPLFAGGKKPNRCFRHQ